jgi:hypothetical protein
MTDEAFDEVIHIHLRGTFTCARAAALRLREQGDGGRIIVVGSPAGQHGSFGQTNYAAAKAEIVAFARTWAMELRKASVTVNAIVPTAWTAMTASIPIYAPLAERVHRGGPLPQEARREHALGMPEDCAPLVVWLSSDAGAGVVGQAIGIGGDVLTLYSHRAMQALRFRTAVGRPKRYRSRGGNGSPSLSSPPASSRPRWSWADGSDRLSTRGRAPRRARVSVRRLMMLPTLVYLAGRVDEGVRRELQRHLALVSGWHRH